MAVSKIQPVQTGTIVDAVENWLDDHISGGETIAIDTSLSVEGAAAEAKATGKMIVAQTTQPTDVTNRVWFPDAAATETDVPTYDEFQDLKSAIGDLDELTTEDKTDIVSAINEVDSLFESGIDIAVADWLDNHPEATTTVQDGSLTKSKFTNTLKLETIKDYVTPEMFGAVGDGVTDDSQALISAINSGYPVKLLNKSYYCNADITIPQNGSISSMSNNGGTNSRIKFANGHGLITDNRYINVSGFMLEGDGTGSGITINGELTAYMVSISKMLIYNFAIGINCIKTMWDCSFIDIRITNCGTGFTTENNNTGSMTTTLINVHFNHCTRDLRATGLKATFIGCNFGIDTDLAVIIENVSGIVFINCNFECDTFVDTTKSLISVNSRIVEFIGCIFKIKTSATASVFSTYGGLKSMTFRDCAYDNLTGNLLPDSRFFNPSQPNTGNYMAIRFEHGNQSIPRPDFDSTYFGNFIDIEKGKPLSFWQTNIDKTKLYQGCVLYSYTNKCLCVYDGTNIVSQIDGTVIV